MWLCSEQTNKIFLQKPESYPMNKNAPVLVCLYCYCCNRKSWAECAQQRWALEWTWIGMDPAITNFVGFVLDWDCQLLHKVRIRTGFRLS